MIIELLLLFLSCLLILTILVGLIYYGLFTSIEIKVGKPPIELSGQQIAYKLDRGPYKEAGHSFTELHNVVPHLVKFGIYYDDPDLVEDVTKHRYAVGVIFDDAPDENRETLKLKLETDGYQFGSFPCVDHVVHSRFPFRGSISIVIAMKRVYPALKQYIKEHNLCAHPALEVYKGELIHFMFPLAKQDQFYLFDDDELEEDDELERSDDSDIDEISHEAGNGQFNCDEGQTDSNNLSNRSSTCSSFEEIQAEEK